MATSFTVNRADLDYILIQIRIAEAHASGVPLAQAIRDAYGVSLNDASLLPAGLRTVDGQDNNLLAGQAEFGAADNPFPRLTDPVFRNDADGDAMPFGPPGGPVVTNTDYGVVGTPTPGNGGHSGNVADADPRIISNLIVDMSVNNPAAIAAWFANPLSVEAWHERNPGKTPVAPGAAVGPDDVVLTNTDLAEIPNQSPDIGLSPGFNAFMTFFGQFFDHGLDLVTKANNGTVFIPLQPDDPLYVPGGNTNFMVLTRAAPTLDANGVPQHTNTTTAFVDQNQTYTSHSSHQVFLREYAKIDVPDDSLGAVAMSTGRLLDGSTASGSLNGAVANWGEVKAQALEMLGIKLEDTDVVNVPLLKTDQYGNFIPGPNGYAQLVMAPDATHATTWFKEGTAAGITTNGAVKTGHAFLDDLAHTANPVNSQTGAFMTADGNTTIGLSSPIVLSNDSFETDSMASGSPGVIDNAALGNYAFIDPQGWDITGVGGVYAPTAAAIGATGHSGGNVVFLGNAATLVRNTGISLEQGSTYQMTFNVGDRLDSSFGGGSARLVTTDGTVLATIALPTPANGQWAPVTLSTGAVSLANAGKELRIEFLHGGSGQVLIDNVQLGSVAANTFDNEHLDQHFITGDGRGNENVGLTAVHTIFHAEHNRLVDANKATILASGDRAFINEWLLVDIGANDPVPTDPAGLVWDGERLFQAARFVTEMQYQHLVFEEFARRVQPNVDAFIFTNTADVDPSIVAEFAHAVYRFGHSMLTGTVDRLENDLTTVNGDADQMTLIEAFLNPQGFINSGATLQEAAANLIRGLTRDVGNEMDEFIVTDVRSNLLGLPLDLAAINIARGRDTGVPSLNETRKQLYEDFGLADLKPYTSWTDFAQHIKHPVSIINFIAAYGTHSLITAEDTVEGKRAAAMAIVLGTSTTHAVPADRLDFLNGRNAYAGTVDPLNSKDLGGLGGLNDVDLWIGGLAEELNEFGGMLGSTFNFIFEYQMERLQNGDRLYYLSRTQGLNLLNQLEPNSITDLVMRNTRLGDSNSTHLNGALFTTPDMILELDASIAQEDYNSADPLSKDPIHDDPFLQAIDPKVYRVAPGADIDGDGQADGGVLQFSGGEHVVLGGTEGNDTLIGDKGIDTLWGDGGDDYLNAGMESDDVFGGEGDDIIEDPFGDDVLRGNQGNDVISAGTGLDLIFGDQGKDFLIVGQDDSEAFGGEGDDFILGGTGKDFLLGGEGDDWIEGGEGFDTIAGENSELFFNSPIKGHDVLWGQGNDQDYDSESGDDIMLSGPGIQRFEGMFGFDWGIAKFDPLGANYDFQIPIFTTIPADILRDRFDQVEAASGWILDDILRGDDRGHSGGSSSPDSTPVELFVDHTLDAAGIQRISGLNALLGGTALTPITSFKNGNILLGGDGNDLIQGRGGFDVIDGDAWLNVRIAITQTKNGGAVVGTAEGLTSQVFAVDANGNATTTVLHGGRTLNALMLDGTLNPGQLQIVREIKYDDTNVTGDGKNIDTAMFQGGDLEYEIEGTRIIYDAVTGEALRRVNSTGPESAPLNISDVNGDGFITVRDLDDGTVAAPGRVGGLTVSRGALTDDTDQVVNIERLQFADKTLSVGLNVPNSLATGTVTISDPSPFDHDGNPATPGIVSPIVGQVLTAKLESFLDPDGIPLDANGNPVGLTFEWQTTEAGNDGGWATISTGLTYTVRPVDPAHVLRAVAVFNDSKGVTERIASGQTDNVTAPFSVNENSPAGSVVSPTIPFSLDYDPLGFGGTGVTDGDVVQLTHLMSPGQDAGGRFAIVNGQIVVANGGPVALNYEAGVHAPANQSHQFVDNQYQIVIDTYTDTIANGGTLMASRQFTIMLNDVEPEIINTPAAGAPTITGTENVLTADTSGITDANGVGTIFSYRWELSTGETWNPISGATSQSFTVPAALANQMIRVVVSYTDQQGFSESVASTMIAKIGNNANVVETIDGTAGVDLLNGRAGNDTINGLGGNDILNGGTGNDTINGGDGDDAVNGGAGNDTINGGIGNDTIDGGLQNDIITGGAGNDTIAGGDGNDNLTGGTGNDALDGGAGTADVAVFAGPITDYDISLNASGQIVVASAADGTDTITGIERLSFGGTLYTALVNGTNGADAALLGGAGTQFLMGFDGNDTIVGGTGNDAIHGGAGDDTIAWAAGDGRDVVNGGTEGAAGDTFSITGAAGSETFRIYTRAAAAAPGGIGYTGTAEIVITRAVGVGAAVIIAELSEIEEIIVNTLNTTANNGNNPTTPDGGVNGGDTIQVIGDFLTTSLNFNTITIDGDAGDDTVDISALSSAHRIVFRSNGGHDTIVGALRPQDVIELPAGATPDDYAMTTDANGVTTMTGAAHSLHFTSPGGLPQFGNAEDADDAEDEDVDPDDDAAPGSEGGADDDEAEVDADDAEAAPVAGTPYIGTPASDVFVATSGADLIIGAGGEDYLLAQAGADVVRAGAGDDYVNGGAGADMIFGEAGDDDLFGADGDDMVYGGAGDDLILGGAGNDLITGGEGDDSVIGGAGNDLFVAGIGDGNDAYYGDAMTGGLGNDTLDMAAITANIRVNLGANNGHGSASSDQSGTDVLHNIENVVTGSGADTIVASNAVNVMDGGAGDDRFVFTAASAADGDTILGFEAGDTVDLSGIDAQAATGADDSFTLLSGGASAAAGSLVLTYETRAEGEFTVLEGHVDGTGEPGFRLSIAGHVTGSDITL